MKNPYQRFADLLGRPLRAAGVCVAATATESTIEYPGLAHVTVLGVGTIGQRYFVFDGRLDGEAPNLPVMEIEV